MPSLARAPLAVSALALTLATLPLEAQPDPPLVVEEHTLPRASSTGVGDRTLTVVRVDPGRFALRLLSSGGRRTARTAPGWVRAEGLAAVINAGMFMPDGRSVGFMMDRDQVRSARRPGRFEAVLGFDPREGGGALRVAGPGCGGDVDAVRSTHASVLQARKVMIDCRGHARPWRSRRYSAAMFGVDRRGWAVLLHVRTPYRMDALARMIEGLELGVRGLVYMEGGPEASLVVRHGRHRIDRIGSWEDGFNPNDDNRVFWDLPNVIGVRAR
ncbi:MAG: phosphodiester glycosidase family protein [Myxococcota bacterium]